MTYGRVVLLQEVAARSTSVAVLRQ